MDNASFGGATTAALRLCRGLRQRGHRLAVIHDAQYKPPADYADVEFSIEHRKTWTGRISTVVKCEPWRRQVQRRFRGRFDSILREFRPDVVNVHNLHAAEWDIEVVETCLRHAPAFWTLHDMWALTGSCAYSYDCRRFETQCTPQCPQVGVYPVLPPRMIAAAHRRRKALYARSPRLVHVAPSRWLTGECSRAAQNNVPARHIAYGLDLNVYRPLDKHSIRDLLRLPDDGAVYLMAAADDLSDRRKGFADLVEALHRFDGADVHLLLMGGAGRSDFPASVKVHRLGAVRGEAFLPLAYNAADLLVCPSHADNLPLVVQEALACGTPAVAYSVGGVPDMVVPEKTGWLAREIRPQALADAIGQALSERERWPEFSRNARRMAEREFSLELQARRYEELFYSIRDDPHRPVAQARLDELSGQPTQETMNHETR